MSGEVEVSQAARDIAAEITGYEAMAYGMSDLSDAVQAAARFEAAIRAECASGGAGLREAAKRLCHEARLAGGATGTKKATVSADAYHALRAALSATPHPERENDEDTVEYEVWQKDAFGDGDAMVAGSTDLKDAAHYAAVFGQDGPTWIVEVRRRPLPTPPGDAA